MTNYPKHLPTNTYNARQWVRGMYSIPGVTWERFGEILDVPAPTLRRFAKGGKLPQKYKRNLGLYHNRKLHDMPKRELRWAIKHREDY